jgi:hypothetical protein
MTLYWFDSRSTRPSSRKSQNKSCELTPRSRFIVADALACYVAHQQQSCDAESWANEMDACALLFALVGEEHVAFFASRFPNMTVDHVGQRAPQPE